jgi:Carbohydrate family 9 binding domain-like
MPPSDAALPVDAGGCDPILSPSTVSASALSNAIVIDGDLSDWGCPPFVSLNSRNGAVVRNRPGAPGVPSINSEFAVRWDATALYVAVRVTVPMVGGNSPTEPYNNSAVQIYLNGEQHPSGDYTALGHQYVMDWKQLAFDYGPNPLAALPSAGFTFFTKKVSDSTFIVEAKILAANVGVPSFTSGLSFGFDIMVDDGDGTAEGRSSIAWAFEPHGPASCTTAKCCANKPADDLWCDTLLFGKLLLK